MTKRALITGCTGQDGSYLAELLLEKGYEVYGLHRRTSTGNFQNINHLTNRLHLIQGDVTDVFSLDRAIEVSNPDEIYHEADQDNVEWSFSLASYAIDVTIKGVSNVLELVDDKTKVFIPCSAMMFGDAPSPQREDTPFNPMSPYAVAKVAAYYLARYHREAYGKQIYTAALYNHDSTRRHGIYLLHKICRLAVNASWGRQSLVKAKFYNLDAKINLGYAKDYAECIIRLMQTPTPDDYVLGSTQLVSIRELIKEAFESVGISDYLDYVEETLIPSRPGPIHTLHPDCTKYINAVGPIPDRDPLTIVRKLTKHFLWNLK